MYKNKLTRHAAAFIVIVLASALLYPAMQRGFATGVWLLLASILVANLLILVTN